MKRKLSLLLAVVMILSSFSFVFADEEVNVPAFLEKNGILKGDKSGNLMLDKALERRDAVVLLSRLLKAEEEAKNYEPAEDEIYPDNNDPYYAGFLGWATANGYFEGYPNGNFKPRESILVQEFALVLLRALEYGDTEWKSVMDKAKELGILEGVKEADANAAIVREDVATMIFNALGVTMKKEGKTLAEFLGIEMPAPKELKATVKDTENLKEIKVELSNAKLANEDKLLNTSNYRLEGNVIERAELKGNDLLLEVRDTFRSGKQYELQIKGVDKAIDGKYKFVARDNTIPSVEKVEVLGEYGIKVITSEPIEDVRGRNFLVDGKYIVMDVERYGRNIILTPYSGSFPSGAKTLTIEGLRDFAGYKSAKEDFDIEIVKDNEAPKVVDAILKGNKVEVVFDKDIYKPSVAEYYSKSDPGNISYELGRHTIYANKATKVDTNKVVYEFKDSEAPSRRDEVTIVDVENHSRVKMEKTTIALREILDDIEPEIIKKEIEKRVSDREATIKLYFDKDVTGVFEKDSNGEYSDHEFDVDAHFALYEDEVSKRNKLENDDYFVSASYYYDAKAKEYAKDIIVVELKGLKPYKANSDTDFEYILEIEGFADAASSRNKMYRDYYEFKFSSTSSFTIKNIEITRYSKDTQIEIEFNKKLDRDIAEDATNYTFYKVSNGKKVMKDDIADLEGEAILKSNGYVVVLEIPEKWEDLREDYDGLRILDAIKDRDGNRLDKVYYYDFETGFAENDDYTIARNANGDFVVTPKEGVKSIKLDTDVKGVFIVDNTEKDVEELVINAPNADVIVKGTIKNVVIEAIKSETLTIAGTVEKVTVKTDKLVNIIATGTTFKLVSTVEKAKVKVNNTEIELQKDKVVEVRVDENDNVEQEEVEKIELENAKQKLGKAITEAAKLLDNANLKDEVVRAALVVAKAEAEDVIGKEEATLKEVNEALTELNKAIKNAEDAIAKELEAAKEAAKDELDKYKDPANYTVNSTDLANAIATGKENIDAAKTTEEVDTALANAKRAIDEIESDADLVEKAKENLDLGDLSAVTTDLTLPSTQDEATVTWASSNPDVIANDGKVTRPAFGSGDATVTLTATIKVGAAEGTKVFTVTVLAEDE
ncbi:immunoglobulin-like domain-containing protein [Tepidimicrobium xylanilyticum]